MDLNKDGKLDLVSGNEDGAIWYFKNIGKKGSPELAEGVKLETEGKPICAAVKKFENVDGEFKEVIVTPASSELAHLYSKIHLADWDGDGFEDLFVGHEKGEFVLYINTGDKDKPGFGKAQALKRAKGDFPFRPSLWLCDWDGDGKKDLIVGGDDHELFFYKNMGTEENRVFEKGIKLEAGGKPIKIGIRARMAVADWNNDGKMDLLAGDYAVTPVPNSRKKKKSGNIWVFLQK